MKKTAIAAALALTLSLPMGLCACGQAAAAQVQTQEQAHLKTIERLEGLLEEKDKELADLEQKYLAQIAVLEHRLSALEADSAGKEEEASSVVFRYRVQNGEAVITGYSGEASLLNLPAELDGYPVVAIGERAFEGSGVAGVVVPEGIVSIGWFAFYGCGELTHVTLPQSVQSIGYAVFDGCPDVTLFCPKGSYAEAFAKSYGLCCYTG